MTDATPTQPTGSGKLIWRKPLTEDVIELGTAPDPRDLTIAALRESLEAAHRFGITNHERAEHADARIAELEAALSSVRDDLSSWRISFPSHCSTMRTIDAALMPAPERDMTITQEAMNA